MARLVGFLVPFALLLLASASIASAAVVEHTFHVGKLTVNRLCKDRTIAAVNGAFPGPTIDVHEGDTLVVHVYNDYPHNVTIHWHGVFQLLSAWADGPNMITQCPIQPGHKYTYRFKIERQEGTLWWHAHVSWLRATVYGALIIRPRPGDTYPFPKPHKEVPILLGEWWNADVLAVEDEAAATGAAPNLSDAFTINGLPGDFYPCSAHQMYKLVVKRGKTYLLRIINAALNHQHFFKIAGHKLTVVGVDAAYTDPYVTDVVVIAPGQTVEALLCADQHGGSYYMAARAYASAPGVPFTNTTTRGVLEYKHHHRHPHPQPVMPVLPAFNDTPTAHRFYSNLTSLLDGRHWKRVPLQVDEKMFVTVGVNLEPCPPGTTCLGLSGQRMSASMNNHSFVRPSSISMLEAFFHKIDGVYTRDFPDNPPVEFDYTNPSNSLNPSLLFAPKTTSTKTLKFGSVVEMVLQNTALIAVENHPMHIHGFNFHVLAQGFGNYDPVRDPEKFNLVNPQCRNTIAVPVGGWAVIRFVANNPGIWLVHCHLDVHLPWGLAMTFEIEDGPHPWTQLPPPPADLPKC